MAEGITIAFLKNGATLNIVSHCQIHRGNSPYLMNDTRTFHDKEVIFQNNNTSYNRANRFKASLQERRINWIKWPANSPNPNPEM